MPDATAAATAGVPPRRNPALVGFRPLDGGPALPIGDWPEGCPRARAAGTPTSLAAVYAGLPRDLPPAGARMAAAAPWLPYLSWPGLGEGGTPLVALPPPAPLSACLVKAEWMNPTGSHKDRMSPLVVARALEVGAPGIACASSGNAGISLAAYAARAGIACRVVVTSAVPALVRRALRAHGAAVVEAPDSLERWAILRRMACGEGWYAATNYALPASGSSAWGVEGYRSLAFELAAEAGGQGWDAVLVPTARGDLISGLALGFDALRQAGLWPHAGPRLVAVEPFPRLSRVLAGAARSTDAFEGRTRQSSTAGATTTDQARRAVAGTGGVAVVVGDEAAEAAQAELAARHGMFIEPCAAAGWAALHRLAEAGWLAPGARAVLVATAAGHAWSPPETPRA